MGTKSNIAIERTNGAVDVIQCQYDGYPGYNGAMLLKHYNTPERVRELIKLGDISYLAENPAPTGPHSYDKPQNGVTVAYGRDRGEDGTDLPARRWKASTDAMPPAQNTRCTGRNLPCTNPVQTAWHG